MPTLYLVVSFAHHKQFSMWLVKNSKNAPSFLISELENNSDFQINHYAAARKVIWKKRVILKVSNIIAAARIYKSSRSEKIILKSANRKRTWAYIMHYSSNIFYWCTSLLFGNWTLHKSPIKNNTMLFISF